MIMEERRWLKFVYTVKYQTEEAEGFYKYLLSLFGLYSPETF